MVTANLKPFLRHHLDVLFVGLNPPVQSNAHGHYFSGKQSRFFHLLTLSGLIVGTIDKHHADISIFGDTRLNYHQANYGVVDLMPSLVETNSNKVQPTQTHVDHLMSEIRTYQPRIVCVIHAKVRDAFNRSPPSILAKPLNYGACGVVLHNCPTLFFLNYFPNGNAVSDSEKTRIFSELKALL